MDSYHIFSVSDFFHSIFVKFIKDDGYSNGLFTFIVLYICVPLYEYPQFINFIPVLGYWNHIAMTFLLISSVIYLLILPLDTMQESICQVKLYAHANFNRHHQTVLKSGCTNYTPANGAGKFQLFHSFTNTYFILVILASEYQYLPASDYQWSSLYFPDN